MENARVTATNVETGIKTEAFTNDVGNYTFRSSPRDATSFGHGRLASENS